MSLNHHPNCPDSNCLGIGRPYYELNEDGTAMGDCWALARRGLYALIKSRFYLVSGREGVWEVLLLGPQYQAWQILYAASRALAKTLPQDVRVTPKQVRDYEKAILQAAVSDRVPPARKV